MNDVCVCCVTIVQTFFIDLSQWLLTDSFFFADCRFAIKSSFTVIAFLVVLVRARFGMIRTELQSLRNRLDILNVYTLLFQRLCI